MKKVSTSGTKVTTSPYFSFNQSSSYEVDRNDDPTWCSSSSSLTNPIVSPYFLRSPSSVYGSVLSMGPLIYAWTSQNVRKIRKQGLACCQRSTLDHDAPICTSCQPLIVDALHHFDCCPIFQEKKRNAPSMYGRIVRCDAVLSHDGDASKSCIERVGYMAENDWVRHLCPHQCFLRAFAPSRDWIALRRALQCRTDASVDTVLRDWTCRLARVSVEDDEDTTEQQGYQVTTLRKAANCYHRLKAKRCRLSSDPPPKDNIRKRILGRTVFRTEFVAFSNGEKRQSFSSLPQILRQLGCDTGDTIETEVAVERSSFLSGKRICFEEQRQDLMRTYDQNPTLCAMALRIANVASPLGLLEELFTNQPWRLLICTIFLNRTQRKQVDAILYDFLQRWPTPESLIFEASEDFVDCADCSSKEQKLEQSLAELVAPMGMTNRRARGILQFCREYLSLQSTKRCNNQQAAIMDAVEFSFTRKEICSLFYCGDYAADAYQLFIKQDFKSPVLSKDHALLAYSNWKQSHDVNASG